MGEEGRRWPSSEALLASSPSESAAFLLELSRRQAGRRGPATLMQQWARDRFVEPSAHDLRTLHALDGIALRCASAFEAVQLSPVAPLGVCSALAPTSQDRTLSAHRGTEVVSDPTNVLALECARRLHTHPRARVRLCTSHQTLRAQALPPSKGFSRHFRLFVLAQAGRGLAEDGFEVEAFVEHAQLFDAMFDTATRELGCRFEGRCLQLLAPDTHPTLAGRVERALREALPHVPVVRGDPPHDYYDGLRVLFRAVPPGGSEPVALADTGRFDWMRQLTSNRRLRYVASGIGIQLFDALFRESTAGRG